MRQATVEIFVDEAKTKDYLICAVVAPSEDLLAARKTMRALEAEQPGPAAHAQENPIAWVQRGQCRRVQEQRQPRPYRFALLLEEPTADGHVVPSVVDPLSVCSIDQADRHPRQRPCLAGMRAGPVQLQTEPAGSAAAIHPDGAGVRTYPPDPICLGDEHQHPCIRHLPCGAARSSLDSVTSSRLGKSRRHPRCGGSSTSSGERISTRRSSMRSHSDDSGPSRAAGSTSTGPDLDQVEAPRKASPIMCHHSAPSASVPVLGARMPSAAAKRRTRWGCPSR